MELQKVKKNIEQKQVQLKIFRRETTSLHMLHASREPGANRPCFVQSVKVQKPAFK